MAQAEKPQHLYLLLFGWKRKMLHMVLNNLILGNFFFEEKHWVKPTAIFFHFINKCQYLHRRERDSSKETENTRERK
jgi:hypothetical protein